jgi:hypothetical protein
MANMCSITLCARGFKDLSDAEQCAWIFRDEKEVPLYDVAWSISPSENKVTASGWGRNNATGVLNSIYALSKRFGAAFEILGIEPGCETGEHYAVDTKGNLVISEYFDYQEFFTDDYNSYSDFVAEHGHLISEQGFNDLDFFSHGTSDTEFGEYIDNLTFPAL